MADTVKQKKTYGKWSSESMADALKAVKVDDVSVRQASKAYGIPRGTLQRHITNQSKHAKDEKRHFGRPTILTKEMVETLVTHILHMLKKMLFGLSKSTLQELAFQMAIKNDTALSHLFNADKKIAGRKWFRNFLLRNPQLCMRNPEPTSIVRAAGFNKPAVYRFYDILEATIDKCILYSTRIFNMDETSLSTVQKPDKIVAQKGKHQVGYIVSSERGTSVT